jgi:glycosyltransferase involved in cell wall biosynthesis
MKIAIDISPLESGHKDRGTGVYIKNIVSSLYKYDQVNSYIQFTRRQKIPKEADLIYYPYFDQFFLTLPIFHYKPRIVTVHDIIPIVYPAYFPSGIRGKIKWILQKSALKNTNRILVSSENTRNDINRLLHIPDKQMDLIYLAPSPIFKPSNNDADLKRIAKKYVLPQKYFVYVGDINWNKNISGLITAFSHLKTENYPNIKLLLVGKSFINPILSECRDITKLISDLNIKSEVITPGFIPDMDLSAIYSMATAYIQPSFYEGFGFPVLEAMASGCPVVTTCNSSLREISGPSILVESDPDSILMGLKKALQMNSAERNKAILAGLEWVKKFTWQKTVNNIMKSYEKVAE